MRRSGLGTRAFDSLREAADINETSIEVLSANKRAMRFWHSLGFTDRYAGMRLHAKAGSTGGTNSAAALERRDPEEASKINAEGISLQGVVGRGGELESETAFILEGLREFNDRMSPYHRVVRNKGQVTKIAVMLVDRDDQWVGGIVGGLLGLLFMVGM